MRKKLYFSGQTANNGSEAKSKAKEPWKVLQIPKILNSKIWIWNPSFPGGLGVEKVGTMKVVKKKFIWKMEFSIFSKASLTLESSIHSNDARNGVV